MEKSAIGFTISDAVFCTGTPPKVPKGIFPSPLPRRMSKLSQAVLYCVAQLAARQGNGILQLPLVYASRHGELDRTHALFEEWSTYGEMSPAGFSLAVHNATASLLGLACNNHNFSTTLAAAENTIPMSVMEAALVSREYGTPCLLAYGDCHPELMATAQIVQYAEESNSPLPQTFKEMEETWLHRYHP